MWSFGCIAYELFTGRKAFSNDHEAWQYGVNNRSPKMYFKGLDDLTKHYVYGLLEAEPEKRPSARALLKERFLTEIPTAASSEEARARKRRRTTSTIVIQPSPSLLLNETLKWAVLKRQLDLILELKEAGIKPSRSLEVVNMLEAFRGDSNGSSDPKAQSLISSYPLSFWIKHVPGFQSAFVPDPMSFVDHENAVSRGETSWDTAARSRIDGVDWFAIWFTRCFSVTLLYESNFFPPSEFISVSVLFSRDGEYLAAIRGIELTLNKVSIDSARTEFSPCASFGSVSCAQFTHDCSRLVIVHLDGRNYVWGMEEKKAILSLESKILPTISEIDVSQDDTRVVGISHNEIYLWSLETGHFIWQKIVDFGITSVAMFPNGKFVLLATVSSGVVVWDLDQTFREVRRWMLHDKSIRFAVSHTNPLKIVSLSYSNKVRFSLLVPSRFSEQSVDLDASLELYITETLANEDCFSTACFSPDDIWVVSGGSDGSVRFWRHEDGMLGLVLQGPKRIEGSSQSKLC